ncbi:MAG: XRE family transcriptional regulator [Prevotella sp.]|jgi:mannose-6-phosphate isomerase-like protein (cupin superfamily)|nr:XRE family transcriptional regulator [Prevotella sp.]
MEEDAIKQIGHRLKGLRDIYDVTPDEMAKICETSTEHYLKIENGEADPSVYRMSRIAKHFGIDLNVLLFDEEPRMDTYSLVRKNQGLCAARNKNYMYQSLASGFKGRKVDPFLVKVNPLEEGKNYNKNSHGGQEFDIVIDGTLELTLEDKVLTLTAGDSIYFDATRQHCMRAVGDEPVTFLCVII